MKNLIKLIVTLLIAFLAFMYGQAKADVEIVPKSPGDGWRVVEMENYEIKKPPKYKWVKVPKTKAELRREIYFRKQTILENRRIRLENRRKRYEWEYGRRIRYYRPLKKLRPLQKWKWIKVEVQ